MPTPDDPSPGEAAPAATGPGGGGELSGAGAGAGAAGARPSGGAPRWVPGATIFLGSFLLFVCQPLLGKWLLPWFGGAPAVWTTCMLFFQVALLLGYTYAHGIDRRLPARRQGLAHAVLLGISALGLLVVWARWGSPLLLPTETWRPEPGGPPISQVASRLAVAVGLPFVLLSTTSPLLSRWYSLLEPGGQPYRLYALSNAGSLGGLLAYPFVIERVVALPAQAVTWGILYLVYVAGCATCALGVARAGGRVGGTGAPGAAAAGEEKEGAEARPARGTLALWVLLPAVTSALLLAVTNELSREVGVVPLLWVVPLALYLLSFIICFERPGWYERRIVLGGLGLATAVVMATALQGFTLTIPLHACSFGIFLFLFCMACHGELVRLRPAHRHLTAFYLAVAAGGALGGVLVALVAPAVFSGYWEFHGVVLVGWATVAWALARDPSSSARFRDDAVRGYLVLLLFALAGLGVGMLVLHPQAPGGVAGRFSRAEAQFALLVAAAVSAGLFLRWRGRLKSALWSRVLLGLILFSAECYLLPRVRATRTGRLFVSRNFFGVVQVKKAPAGRPDGGVIQLVHGRINHGFQYLKAPFRSEPTGYYARRSGAGMAIAQHPRRVGPPDGRELRVGLAGLGIGTLAAFARAGDLYRFYEINPTVIELAQGKGGYFTNLTDCRGSVESVLGDARLALEIEFAAGRPGRFDVLVLDAFSSDAVPVHLLTREAFVLYLQHLRDEESIIAVNISNRFVDLRPVLAAVAEEFGLQFAVFTHPGDPPLPVRSRWVVLARPGRALARPPLAGAADGPSEMDGRRLLWTDAFSSLIPLLH